MTNINIFIILPIIGALIGWITNYIAIKMLFHPRKKILGFQGIIPKRKKILSEKISQASLSFLPSKIDKLTKIPYLGEKIQNYIKKEIKTNVNKIEDKELEKIIYNISKKELRFIQILGAILGTLIGIIQALILKI
jgi:uncharacterized membrane protein YheB (UPF0754 family)